MNRLLFLCALLLAACTNPNDLDRAPADLGAFRLGYVTVVAPGLTKGPFSRSATEEEWITAMTGAIEERFGRYEGDQFYHIAISLEGYALARAGIPVVAAPKSALLLKVTIWEDSTAAKLNAEPHLVTAMETLSGKVLVGSGLTQNRNQQMRNLVRNAAKLVENWMRVQHRKQGWFRDAGPVPPALSAVPAGE